LVRSLIFNIFIVFYAIENIIKSSILNQDMDVCKDILSDMETKLNKSFIERKEMYYYETYRIFFRMIVSLFC